MKVKSWQLVIIVLGLLVGVGMVAWTIATGPRDVVNYKAHYIDVETGDIYAVDTSKQAIGAPARHPTTNRMCLVRLTPGEKSGEWIVSRRDLATLQWLDKDVKNNAVDPETGQLKVPAKAPVDYVKGGK